MNLNKKIILVILLFLIIITRFLYLDRFFPNLNMDEVAIGYNAYSIIETGRDERGNLLPLYFQSVGDFKLPVIIYLTAPFVGFFGLNELSVRLPAAIFSTLSIFLIFILSKKHIFKEKYSWASYLSSFILTISPWHIVYSRYGYEVVIAFFFVLLNLYFLFELTKKSSIKNLWLVFISSTLAILTYNSSKMTVPLINLSFIIIYHKQFIHLISINIKKQSLLLLFSLIVQALLILIILKLHYFGPGASRAQSIFIGKDYEFDRILLQSITNESLFSLKSGFLLLNFWLKRIFEYLSVNFYLYSGLNIVLPGEYGMGVLYPIELILIILSLPLICNKKKCQDIFQNSKTIPLFIFIFIFFSFLPASLTNNTQQSLRSLFVVFPLTLLITYTIIVLINKFFKHKTIITSLIITGYILGIIRFSDYYLVHYPYQLSEHQHYGWTEITKFALNHASEYEKVIIDPRFGSRGQNIYGVPHLYFLFYSRYNPRKYQLDPRRLNDNGNFENFIFEPINWQHYNSKNDYLFIGSPWSFIRDQITPSMFKYKVNFINGQEAFYAISGKEIKNKID